MCRLSSRAMFCFFFFSLACASVLIDANVIASNGQGIVPAIKVKDVVESPNCLPDARVSPLFNQIVAQSNCRSGTEVISTMSNMTGMDLTALRFPFLLRGAWNSLRTIAASSQAPLTPMRITRALTPFVVQYFFFRRGFLRICGVSEEIPYVGETVWERGTSVEISNAEEWAPLFALNRNWVRTGISFTYNGPDTLNVGRRSIETFQLMWNNAYPDAPIPVSGRFDAATQVATEQAFASGLVFSGLCAPPASSGSFDQEALLLVIIVPSAALGFLVFLLVTCMTIYFRSHTPFDGGGGRSVVKSPDVPDDLHNSVEDTSVLSEYARSELDTKDEEVTREEDATSGIWQDE